MSVMSEREEVIDFTVPFYDLVGISILMRKREEHTFLFKYLTVFGNDVWLAIVATFVITRFNPRLTSIYRLKISLYTGLNMQM